MDVRDVLEGALAFFEDHELRYSPPFGYRPSW